MGSPELQVSLLMETGSISHSNRRNEFEKYDSAFSNILDNKKGLRTASVGQLKEGNTTHEENDWLECFKNKLNQEKLCLKNVSLPTKLKNIYRKEKLKDKNEIFEENKSMTVDLENILNELLKSEGYKEKDVKKFLTELLENGNKKEVSVAELIDKVIAFRKEKEKNAENVTFPKTYLFGVENILKSIGLDIEKIANIIEKAKDENGKIRTKNLADEIRKAENEIGKQIKNDKDKGYIEEQKKLLFEIGLQKEADRVNGTVTLKQFARMIENHASSSQLVKQKNQVNIEKDIKTLVENIRLIANENNIEGKSKNKYIYNILEKKEFGVITKNDQSNVLKKGKRINNDNLQIEKNFGKNDYDSNDIQKIEDIVSKVEKLIGSNKTADMHKIIEKRETNQNSGEVIKETDVFKQIQSDSTIKEVPKNIPYYVVNQVGRKLGLALKRGESQVRVQLKPPELGAIELSMSMKNNVLKLAIVSEQQAVKELLMSHVNELRSALVEQGIDLQKVDVQIEYNLGQFMTNAQKDAHNQKTWKKQWGSSSNGWREGITEIGKFENRITADGMVDMFA